MAPCIVRSPTHQLTGANVAKDSGIHVDALKIRTLHVRVAANFQRPSSRGRICASTLSAHAHCGGPKQFLKVVSKEIFISSVPLAKSLFVFICLSFLSLPLDSRRPETWHGASIAPVIVHTSLYNIISFLPHLHWNSIHCICLLGFALPCTPGWHTASA